MDITAEQKQLEDELSGIEQYLSHPVSRQIIQDNKEQQEKAIDLLCNCTVNSIETFFAHFEAVGHLRGLRRANAIVQDSMEEIKEQLKNLK